MKSRHDPGKKWEQISSSSRVKVNFGLSTTTVEVEVDKLPNSRAGTIILKHMNHFAGDGQTQSYPTRGGSSPASSPKPGSSSIEPSVLTTVKQTAKWSLP